MKRKLLILTYIMTFFININSVYALHSNIPVSITINGNYIYTDSEPFILNNRVFVPLRFVVETLGVNSIEWNNEEQSVLILTEDKAMKVFIDKQVTYVNGQEKPIDAAPVIVNSRTMVPIRFIAEELNCNVEWDKSTYIVNVLKDDLVVEASNILDISYSKEDIILLSKIVTVEGGNLSLEGKVAIANVVINRKNSPQFPNTIHDVIYDSDYHVQFPPAHKPSFATLTANEESILAAKLALNGYNNISKCLFFNNRPFKSKSSDLYKRIEGEYFYY